MLTQAPPTASQHPPPDQRPDDMSGRRHRQVIGYLGLALPILLVQMVRLRPNAASDQWSGDSISAYYWTGAVSLFAGLLAALSLFLLTYRGYANESHKADRAAAIIAGIAAAIVAIFPTTPPTGSAALPWWTDWISKTHTVAAIILFSMFAVFSLWLFRKTAFRRATGRRQKAAQCDLPFLRHWHPRQHGLGVRRGTVGQLYLLARVVCPRLLRVVLARQRSGSAFDQVDVGCRERQSHQLRAAAAAWRRSANTR